MTPHADDSRRRFLSLVLLCTLAACNRTPPAPPPGMALVPAGEFIMGSNKTDTEKKATEFGTIKPWFLDEQPERKTFLPDYFMDVTEVTNAQYKLFVDATGARPPQDWTNGQIPAGRENYPVTYVNWYDADRYCRWAGKRLPAEAEWEKAARGTDGREYPWGNEFDPKKANTGDSDVGDMAPVGSFPEGKSPYGIMDLSGNVWEWTSDWYKPYPGSTHTSPAFGEKYKVLRGSSWGGMGHYAIPHFYRAGYRFYIQQEGAFPDAGFRCVKDVAR